MNPHSKRDKRVAAHHRKNCLVVLTPHNNTYWRSAEGSKAARLQLVYYVYTL